MRRGFTLKIALLSSFAESSPGIGQAYQLKSLQQRNSRDQLSIVGCYHYLPILSFRRRLHKGVILVQLSAHLQLSAAIDTRCVHHESSDLRTCTQRMFARIRNTCISAVAINNKEVNTRSKGIGRWPNRQILLSGPTVSRVADRRESNPQLRARSEGPADHRTTAAEPHMHTGQSRGNTTR